MRILVFSDSHANTCTCAAIIDKLPAADMIIHAGDHYADAQKLQDMYPKLDFRYVAGNCDSPLYPQEMTFNTGGKNFFLSHGHSYGVKYESNYRTFAEKAKAEHADIGIFGHTHIFFCKQEDGLLLMNPGSIKYGGSFGIIEIEDGKVSADICFANLWL